MNLREQVEHLLPNWERWYPSLFDAATDLGILQAEVCDPNSLLLTRRHAKSPAARRRRASREMGRQGAGIMQYDLDAIRAQFPALAITDNGTPRVYFDNPAGTQVPYEALPSA